MRAWPLQTELLPGGAPRVGQKAEVHRASGRQGLSQGPLVSRAEASSVSKWKNTKFSSWCPSSLKTFLTKSDKHKNKNAQALSNSKETKIGSGRQLSVWTVVNWTVYHENVWGVIIRSAMAAMANWASHKSFGLTTT